MGDRPNAAKSVALLRTMAPAGTQRWFTGRRVDSDSPGHGWRRTRILEGLRLALAG
jgi:hypothetical protein